MRIKKSEFAHRSRSVSYSDFLEIQIVNLSNTEMVEGLEILCKVKKLKERKVVTDILKKEKAKYKIGI